MAVPVVCQRQEPIITTAQKTVEVPQIQSCSADYAVRVLMGVRRAWRLQLVDDCSRTVLTDSLGPESPDEDGSASLSTSPDVSEDNRHSVMSTRKGVNPLTKEECVFQQSPSRVEEARVVQACLDTESAAAAASQHSGMSTTSRCESQRWRTRPCQVLHVRSLDRRSAQQNSSAAVDGTQLRHREHDGSQRPGQQDCDSAEQHSTVQDPGVRAQLKEERTRHHHHQSLM